jgi:hypothetical protein
MTLPFNPRWRIKTDSLAATAVTLAPIFYFLPAILSHLVLGPDDGVIFNVPLRVAAAKIVRSGRLPLWNPYIFSGMPLLGAAQGGLLFPLNWFYLIFSPAVATDLMVVSAYMLAALGAYLFARRTGTSIAGAVVTSMIWQGGGFLIGQISHINIVHTAAMLPWVLWALDRYVSTHSRKRGVILAALVALQTFAGHQQALAYSLMLVAAYAIVMALVDRENRSRYLSSLAFMVTGLLLAAVQIVPTFELLRNSPRAGASYDFFSSFSMPRRFMATFLAPYVMGGGDGRLFRAPYIGQAFYTEYVPYAGLLAIMLALLALLLKPDMRTKFWAAAALVCLVLAFGREAPLDLYRVIYYVPVLNLFRVPARHLMEVNFAIAMLAGRGLTSLAATRGSKQAMLRVAIVAGSVFILTCLIVTVGRPADFHLLRQAPVSLLRAPELFLPIVLAALSAWALWTFARRREGRTLLLLAVLAVDLIVWGQSSGWHKASGRIPAEFWSEPETVKLLREKAPADPASFRIFTLREVFDPATPAPPELRRLSDWILWTEPDAYMMYGVQNAAGYDGFALERYSRLAGQMKLWGELTDPNATLRGGSRELDLLNARYLLSRRKNSGGTETDAGDASSAATEPSYPAATDKYGGFRFAPADLSLPNVSANKRLRFTVPPVNADHLALITNLSWAEAVPDNAPIARVRLTAKDGRVFEFTLRAGIDTADWAFDRPDIRARIRHKRPVVATSYDVDDTKNRYQGHTYVTSFALPDQTLIESGEIVLEPFAKAPDLLLTVFRLSLVNANADKTYPLSRDLIRIESTSEPATSQQPGQQQVDRWRLVAQARTVDIYENSRALPRAWLASEVRALDEGAMLQTIRTGLLPDGSRWDPLRTALMNSEPAIALNGSQPGRAEITGYEPNRINLQTHSSGNSILVLSENDYPGWRVYVDGQPAEVLQVNYALRGVAVLGGDHQVSFIYRPWSVMSGFLISLITAASLILLARRKSESAR